VAGSASGLPVSRLAQVAACDPAAAALLRRLLPLAARGLDLARAGSGFAFTLRRQDRARGQVRAEGTSVRYAAIAALGLSRLPHGGDRARPGASGSDALTGWLTGQLDGLSSRGDAALICWLAAETGHGGLPRAIARLRELERRGGPLDVVSAAWVVTALVAARGLTDVERDLALARARLLRACRTVFPHLIGGPQPWYRSHVGSFADQVYPVQALARLHGSADDQPALAAAERVAAALRRAQGEAGQWPWHYDARTGDVVEDYPVYSVHQHAMAPMALLDLAEAGGACDVGAICRGLVWLAGPPETAENLICDDPPVIWRKVARHDPRKAARGLRAASTRFRAGARLPWLDLVFRPGAVDHECRPYELGWLLYAWSAPADRA
jgi:hypothetical protein